MIIARREAHDFSGMDPYIVAANRDGRGRRPPYRALRRRTVCEGDDGSFSSFFYFLGEKEVESESVQVFGNSKGGLIARFQGSVTAIFYWCCSWNVGGVMGVRQ